MANPYRTSVALTAAVTNGICLSQTLGAAGKLTINGSLASGGVATLTSTSCVARRVGITSAGNDSGITWTITGTNRYGVVHNETLAGANAGTANSVKDYATVTSIAGSAASASTVTAGTNTVASTEWRVFDIYREFFSVGLGFTATGTINATVEITFDDPLAAQPGSLEPASAQPPTAGVCVSADREQRHRNRCVAGHPVRHLQLAAQHGALPRRFRELGTGVSAVKDKMGYSHEEGMGDKKGPMKRGGRMAKKAGGGVMGCAPKKRADKRARGGRMTPSEPFSGAGKMTGGERGSDEEKDSERASGGRLSAASRNALPASDFALPGHGAGKNGKGHGAYPIDTPGRARAALSRGAANASPAEQATIRRKVHEKYPSIE